ncbi:hypothetical protein [Streptomyces sp. NPDC088785]|uniref:hypothetical protein n=1 Tax=Streptomyces sp. NPDC088785 TaxID=3365897 RepID=UPI0038241B8D
MAKNRKQNRNQQEKSAEAQDQQARSSAMEAEAKSAIQATPGDVARKHRERRFGHN